MHVHVNPSCARSMKLSEVAMTDAIHMEKRQKSTTLISLPVASCTIERSFGLDIESMFWALITMKRF